MGLLLASAAETNRKATNVCAGACANGLKGRFFVAGAAKSNRKARNVCAGTRAGGSPEIVKLPARVESSGMQCSLASESLSDNFPLLLLRAGLLH